MRGISPGMALILLLLVAFIVAALAAPWIAPFDPLRQSLLMRLRPPGTTVAAGMLRAPHDEFKPETADYVI